jgi:hypothetical protein
MRSIRTSNYSGPSGWQHCRRAYERVDGNRDADGLFLTQAYYSVLVGDPKNRRIDADSCRNRADSESPKFAFEFKSENF